jgi:hypothetical protein
VTAEETAAGVKGTAVRSRPTYEGTHFIVTDDAGGVIVLWEEDTDGQENLVYAQRLDGNGDYVWPERVTTPARGLLSAESDGAGGVKIGTPTGGTGKAYVHIMGNGLMFPGSVFTPPDAASILGSFRVRIEEDPPNDPPMERRSIIYLQKLDDAGEMLWEKKVIEPPEKTRTRSIDYLDDGSGGVIIIWQLQQSSIPYGSITAQRIDANGISRWGIAGIAVFDVPGVRYQSSSANLGDGSDGVITVAVLGKGGLSGDMVYAQRLDAAGNRLWAGGVRIDR